MADSGPEIIRPVPRRPFDTKLAVPTPPSSESPPPSPTPDLLLSSSQFLFPGLQQQQGERPSLSRLQSFTNLTSPTLLGIYSPTTSHSDRAFFDRDETDTPWGTGAQTPIKPSNLDDATYEFMVDRSHLTRRRSSIRSVENFGAPAPAPSAALVGLRACLLFLLGVGYGVLVTHFHDEQTIGSLPTGIIIKPGYNWKYLTFWGAAGAFLGALLPWFDRVWEETFEGPGKQEQASSSSEDSDTSTDLTLVVRAIGAFMGIAFAIRKLAWDSTMQASATLALVNPLLWWLIDRSLPGFLLSTAVGITGSLLLLGVDPEMMPAPSTSPLRNSSSRAPAEPEMELLTLGGIASQQTVETGIWMLSVLFCSCVCFGNIGRRLMTAKTTVKSTAERGRWAGIQ